MRIACTRARARRSADAWNTELDFETRKYKSAGGSRLSGREGGWIHVVIHLSDNSTTPSRLSPPSRRTASLVYSVTLQGDASLRRPAVPFRSYIPLAFFPPRLTNRQHNARLLRGTSRAANFRSHRATIVTRCDCRVFLFPLVRLSTDITNFAMYFFSHI